jgi:hypothetical protein
VLRVSEFTHDAAAVAVLVGSEEAAAGSQSSNKVCSIDCKAEQVSVSELACKFMSGKKTSYYTRKCQQNG